MPVWPLLLNCQAACVLDRLATLTGDTTYQERARAILNTFSRDYEAHELYAGPYALAVREVMLRRPPYGLNLSYVDWHLDQD